MQLNHSSSISEQLEDTLSAITPSTQDQELLNEQTKSQILDFTYQTGHSPTRCSDSNYLVPQSVADENRESSYRYPPYMEAQFTLSDSEIDEGHLTVSGSFAISQFLQYHEYRPGWHGAVTNVGSIRADLPPSFWEVTTDQGTLDIKKGEYIQKASLFPLIYEFSWDLPIEELLTTDQKTKELETKERQIPVKVKQPNSDTVSADLQSSPIEGVDNSLCAPSGGAATGVLFLRRGPIECKLEAEISSSKASDDKKILTLTLSNYGDDADSEYSLGQMLQSVLNPTLTFTFEGVTPEFPVQQHAEARRSQLEGRIHRDTDRGEIEPLYDQTNGVLTQHTETDSSFTLTSYGVFDYLREEPKSGPSFEEVTESYNAFISHADLLTEEGAAEELRSKPDLCYIVTRVLRAAPRALGIEPEDEMYEYQWKAIQRRLLSIIREERITSVVKAPTGAGKTLVFMVNACILSLYRGTHAVMAFPTRILNEDMYKRLTRFIYELKKNFGEEYEISGGILIGSSDPLSSSIRLPNEGDLMAQYDECPNCDERGSIYARKRGYRTIGVCEQCDHELDYMYGTDEVTNQIPTLTIATPDKLFYEATVRGYISQPYSPLGFFGGDFIRCKECGAAASALDKRENTITCPRCENPINVRKSHIQNEPIGHFVFDEVHSLYGLTGTLLSAFLDLLNLSHSKIIGHDYLEGEFNHKPTFETGTATISNEEELLTSITRNSADDIVPIPSQDEYDEQFVIDYDQPSVRYRTTVLLPVRQHVRQSVTNAFVDVYKNFRDGSDLAERISEQLNRRGSPGSLEAYQFLLGYVYKKSDGNALQKSISERSRQKLDTAISPRFISGDSPTEAVSDVFKKASENEIPYLLANVVMSLGIDINDLNNILMLGAPQSMSEQVQTAGRTGRGDVPGHVTIHLRPDTPRDEFLYENLHRVMTDLEGYYERKPIQSTNAFAAELMMPNATKALLSAISYDDYVLTGPSAKRHFVGDSEARDALQLDLLRILFSDLSDLDSQDRQLINELNRIIERELQYYLDEWSQMSGYGHYLSDWFKDHTDILFSLRATSSKDVPLSYDDDNVLDRVRRTTIDEGAGEDGSLQGGD